MKIPTWILVVNRPWNPAWQETWDAMTPSERRASWLFDAVVVIVVIVVLGACAWFGDFE